MTASMTGWLVETLDGLPTWVGAAGALAGGLVALAILVVALVFPHANDPYYDDLMHVDPEPEPAALADWRVDDIDEVWAA